MLLEVHIYLQIIYLFLFSRKKIIISDYDSELVDGKYVTSVPIVNPEDEAEEAGNDADGSFISFLSAFCLHFDLAIFCFIFSGNLRPSHRQPPRGLRDLKSAANSPADDLMKRYNKKFTIFEISNAILSLLPMTFDLPN